LSADSYVHAGKYVFATAFTDDLPALPIFWRKRKGEVWERGIDFEFNLPAIHHDEKGGAQGDETIATGPSRG
jgi:hypothetical protein